MPATAAVLDQFREVFGEGVKLIRAIEVGTSGIEYAGAWTDEEVEKWRAVDLQSAADISATRRAPVPAFVGVPRSKGVRR